MLIPQVFKDEQAPAFALLYCLLKQYGIEALEWDSVVIRDELEKDLNITISDIQSDKLNAAIEVLTSNLYENNWHVFESCNHFLANVPTDTSIVYPIDVEELAAATAEALLIRHEPLEYSSDINRYVGQILYDYGLSKPPTIFPSAILPSSNKDSSALSEKDEALKQLFDYHLNMVIEYVDKIT